MQSITTDGVAWSVCWSHSRALQRRLKRSRCSFVWLLIQATWLKWVANQGKFCGWVWTGTRDWEGETIENWTIDIL